ncbi:substrate-binding periplasmic protein [Motilimonas eburnea]|uniref:substrate-binding periplasmic protein n=1 Tax=Motilimonas eburnea TaxID=1737488 RepID=UPI001E6342AE|nr:transporter substrate-binding domain-containing protein [Motilimonas eburnea]MCE2572889.1 transporter substrate-binding domain-containing protein [Motilimonas eburnea]
MFIQRLVLVGICFISLFSYANNGVIIVSAMQDDGLTEISKRVMAEAYSRIGYEMRVVECPGNRALHFSNNGKVDGELFRIGGIDSVFENLIQVAVPINHFELVSYTSSAAFKMERWEDLKLYRVGIQLGIIYVERYTEGLQTKSYLSNKRLFQLLDRKRIDVAILDRVNGMKTLTEMGELSTVIPGDLVLTAEPLYHYVHKKNRHLVPELTKVLNQLEKSGRIVQIRNEYISQLKEAALTKP